MSLSLNRHIQAALTVHFCRLGRQAAVINLQSARKKKLVAIHNMQPHLSFCLSIPHFPTLKYALTFPVVSCSSSSPFLSSPSRQSLGQITLLKSEMVIVFF